jgi:FkbM family methyltransferase
MRRYAETVLLDLKKLMSVYGLAPTGVLHLGAHRGEEAAIYSACGIRRVVWVEGNPELLPELRAAVEPYGHRVLQGLLGERSGEPTAFFVTNNGQSSSVLPLGTHLTSHPEVHVTHTLQLVTTTVDQLAADNGFDGLDLLNVDLQGAELQALRGSTTTLQEMKYVYTEVNRDAVYEGAALIGELDAFLAERGFTRMVTRWTTAQWGDALYVRPPVSLARRLWGEVQFRRPVVSIRSRFRHVAHALLSRWR